MADIFISYAQVDRECIESLVRALESQGWSVWWDPQGATGTMLDEMVERELEAAKCVVAPWSETSVRSDWGLGETDDGRERRILVPVALDNVRSSHRFRRFNTVSVAVWNGSWNSEQFRKIGAGIAPLAGEQTPSWPKMEARLGNEGEERAAANQKAGVECWEEPRAGEAAAGAAPPSQASRDPLPTFRDRLSDGSDGPAMVIIPAGRF